MQLHVAGKQTGFDDSLIHLADTFIQNELQMRTIEAIKTPKKEQQHASAMTNLG